MYKILRKLCGRRSVIFEGVQKVKKMIYRRISTTRRPLVISIIIDKSK